MYLLPKIHKIPYVFGKPAISNCGTPSEELLEFLDSHLKRIVQESCAYIAVSNDFINKTKNLNYILEDAPLVTADLVGLKALKKVLDKRKN